MRTALAAPPSSSGDMAGVLEGSESSAGGISMDADVASEVFASMLANRLTRDEVLTMPLGVAVPLLEALRVCRARPPEGLQPAGYALLARDDLVAQVHAIPPPPKAPRSLPELSSSSLRCNRYLQRCLFDAPHPSDWLRHNTQAAGGIQATVATSTNRHRGGVDDAALRVDDDGTTVNCEVTSLRFGRDRRVQEVQRLLCSAKPVPVSVHQV